MSRFHLAPESEARFRAVTNKTLYVSHVRHKCVCGKQATAKALTQYGHCVSCQKAATKPPIKFALTTGRRFWLAPSTWTKARQA